METLSYDYRPKIWVMVLASLFFVACAAVLGSEAATNVQDMEIEGLIHLGPSGTTVVLWLLTASSCGLVACGVWGIYRAAAGRQKLILDAAGVRITGAAFAGGNRSAAYRDITTMRIWAFRGQCGLFVRHAGGSLNIARSMLPTPEIFDKVCRAMEERVAQARPVYTPPSPTVRG